MADQLKQLFTAPAHGHLEPEVKKDKLAQTKIRDREIKDGLKAEREKAKEEKQDGHIAEAKAYRMERSWVPDEHKSRQAKADMRHAEKHERRAENHFECEHGVANCRICRPVNHKK